MDPRIACIGGATLDRKTEPLGQLRLSTSNPVRSEVCAGGCARNVAEALARLGRPVSLFSRVGADAAGDRLLDELARLNVGLDGVDRVDSSPTASYTAILDDAGELAIGLADMEVLDGLDRGWLERIAQPLADHDLWIVDANLPPAVLELLVELAPQSVRIFADPVSVEKACRLTPILGRIEAVFPDRAEAAALAPFDGDPADPQTVARRIRELGPRRVILTLGAGGVWVDDPPRRERVPAMATEAIVDVTGAGDCLLAGYVFAHAAGDELDPIRCGLAAAALAVESPRSVPAGLDAETLLARYRGPR